MKRLFPVLLALLLALSACGGKTPAPVTPFAQLETVAVAEILAQAQAALG